MFTQFKTSLATADADDSLRPRISYVGVKGQMACRSAISRCDTRSDEDVHMKGCYRCNGTAAWRLGDGRYKCQSCGWRYSWRSAWDAIRLPESAKQTLLRAFLGDATVDTGAIASAQRLRFYRLARACCAMQSPVTPDAIHIHECPPQGGVRSRMRGWASAREVIVLGIAEQAGVVRICLPPVSPVHVIGLLRTRSALGGVFCVLDNLAYASLPVSSDYVSIPRGTHGLLSTRAVENFWNHLRTLLQVYRRIPLSQFPLHLGELCFRFNRRNEDLPTLVHDVLQSTGIADVRAFLETTCKQDQPPAATAVHERSGAFTTGTHLYE